MSQPDPATAKSLLREQMLRQRSALDPSERARKSHQIAQQIAKLPQYQAAKIIAGYAGLPSEVATDDLLNQILFSGRQLALPRVVRSESGAALDWHIVTSLTELQLGALGVREPPSSAPQISLAEIDLLLVPGVAFDRAGGRLGLGKGFYDRVLAEFHGTSVGLAFASQLVPTVPMEEWDRSVSLVVTELGSSVL